MLLPRPASHVAAPRAMCGICGQHRSFCAPAVHIARLLRAVRLRQGRAFETGWGVCLDISSKELQVSCPQRAAAAVSWGRPRGAPQERDTNGTCGAWFSAGPCFTLEQSGNVHGRHGPSAAPAFVCGAFAVAPVLPWQAPHARPNRTI